MRYVRRNLPPVFDDECRAIIVQEVVQGEGPETYLGAGSINNGQQELSIRFAIPGNTLEEAFENHDKARDAKLDEINAAQQAARLRI